MKKLLILLGFLIVVSLVLAACTGAPTDESPGQPGEEPPQTVQTEPPVSDVPGCSEMIMGTLPMHTLEDLRVNTSTYPDIIDPQKSSFVTVFGKSVLMVIT